MIAIEDDPFTRSLERLGRELPKPAAVVAVSAHWEAPPPFRVNAAPNPGLLYDFGGFPDELFAKTYPCAGEPALAERIRRRLTDAGLTAELETGRGLDHGVWTPLCRIFPNADIPVVQISLPVPRDPAVVLRLGRILSPLRDDNVLLMGTGGIVHNLRRLRYGAKDGPIDPWAEEFDAWVKSRLDGDDVAALLDYRRRGPQAAQAVQGPEHFDPLFFSIGASGQNTVATYIFEGIQYGNLSLRSIAWN